jgi:hypothetical protein
MKCSLCPQCFFLIIYNLWKCSYSFWIFHFLTFVLLCGLWTFMSINYWSSIIWFVIVYFNNHNKYFLAEIIILCWRIQSINLGIRIIWIFEEKKLNNSWILRKQNLCSISTLIHIKMSTKPKIITKNGILVFPSIVGMSFFYTIVDIFWF